MFCSNGNSGSWVIILILILLFAGGTGGCGLCGNTTSREDCNCGCNNTCC